MLQYLLVVRSSSWKYDLVAMLLVYCSLCMFSYVRVHVIWSMGMEVYCVWCKCCMQWKILNSAFSLFLYTHFPSSSIRAIYHMIYMLKMLIITRVVIIYINICKCCKYRLLLIAIVVIKHVVSWKSCD